jgi:hypothetical protein
MSFGFNDASFGYERQKRVFVGDTATLYAFLYENDDQNLVSFVNINQVLFTVKRPSDPTDTPSISGAQGTITGDGAAEYLVPSAAITEPGEYLSIAQFQLNDGRKKSVIVDFDVVDPFEAISTGPFDPWIDLTWRKIEDCFDSEIGGPWLRDMTLARFDKSKIRTLLPEALLDINVQQPITSFNESSFPRDDTGGALLSQALLVSTLRHLVRSYTEQPDVTSSPVAFLDRKRYSEAWATVLKIEEPEYRRVLALWKRQFFGFGTSKLLVSSKAGRLVPAPMRTRYSGRGYT